jgi:NAD(P)H dehydrogenase (quinone)
VQRARPHPNLFSRLTTCVLALTALGIAASPTCRISAQPAVGADKIIISGASGNLGGLTVKELLARGVPASRLILVSRTPEKESDFAKLGASVRFGDFTKPESLPAAYAGGTRMLLISVGGTKTEPATTLLKRAIDAAKAAGVKQIAYTSYIGISRGDVEGLAANHQQTENDLKASGVAWTMLRNSIYMDGLVGQAARMVADGKAVIPPDESPIGYITRADCAAAAAAVLTTPGHDNKAYDVTGSELLGVREIAGAATAVTGRPIEVVQGGADTRPGFGRPAMAFTSKDFRALTGRDPTDVRELFTANKNKLLTPPAAH